MKTDPWQRILRLMDEAYADYLKGMEGLRTRVVVDLKRKLTDNDVTTPSQAHPQDSCKRRS